MLNNIANYIMAAVLPQERREQSRKITYERPHFLVLPITDHREHRRAFSSLHDHLRLVVVGEDIFDIANQGNAVSAKGYQRGANAAQDH
jgi:hypothetical protein